MTLERPWLKYCGDVPPTLDYPDMPMTEHREGGIGRSPWKRIRGNQ